MSNVFIDKSFDKTEKRNTPPSNILAFKKGSIKPWSYNTNQE